VVAAANHRPPDRFGLEQSSTLRAWFPGYAQEDWVRIGRYADAPWEDLVALWRTFNLQLARVMEGTPMEIRRRPRARHSFAEIGVPLGDGEAATLEQVMSDYVVHLKHHLRQILGETV
jgi:hypothetical protein